MFRPRLHFGLLFLLVCIFMCIACSSPSGKQAGSPTTSTTTPTLSQIGDRVHVGSWVITVNTYSSTGDTGYTPKVGNALLVCTISQQNQGSQPANANGAVDWSLRDSLGTTFPLVTQSGYGTFPSASVAAGETATGTLVYEVPASTRHFLLTFAPAASGYQASWDVPLT